ncbi:MAG: S41 family peptidase [Dehalococcoidia bacterium]
MAVDRVTRVIKASRWAVAALLVAVLVSLAGIVGFSLGEDRGGDAQVPAATDGRRQATAPGDRPDFSILDQIYDVLRRDFVDQNALDDPEVLRQGAIDGIISALGDPHTVYIDPESYELGTDIISGTYQGIGAQVAQDPTTNEIVIVTPFTDSPAEEAGIRPGDAIVAVDGESTEGWSVSQAVRRIRGRPGTDVALTVRHANGDVEDVTITRDVIVVQTVYTDPPLGVFEDASGNPVEDLAYIRIEQFTDQTPRALRSLLQQVVDQGHRGLILDLRLNPGGGLSATVEVADLFLDGGVVLMQVNRDGSERVFEATAGGPATDMPVVVLVGPGSASGAEVLAAALRDNGRATLIGETTFGKGTVNNLRELRDGGALFVSIARWLTPSGEQIEGVGVIPDIPVELTDEAIDSGQDVVLYEAIDFLRQKVQTSP